MNQLLKRIDVLEEVSRVQQRRIDELNSDKRIQQRRIDELGSRVDALERETTKRKIAVASGSTKRIKNALEITFSIDLFAIDSNVVTYIVSYLPPADLVNVGRTCSRFGAIQDGQRRSLANEAARRIFASAAAQYDLNALPQYDDESDIAWLHELFLLREQLEFGQLIGKHIKYTSADSKSKVSTKVYCCNSAMSNLVMRRGGHYAIFNVSKEADDFNIDVGIIRPLPGWGKKELDNFDPSLVESGDDVSQDLLAERTERWGTSDAHCCSYNCDGGDCYWSDWSNRHCEEWDGMEGLDEVETFGLLLDLNEGTLTLYKNGRRLGVMKSGLIGEYCWYTTIGFHGSTVSIERGTLP